MGDSEKLRDSGPGSYTFAEHCKYLFALFDKLGVNQNVTLVIHDWGSGLGFHWAHRNPDAVKGKVFMEAFVAPIPSWDDFPEEEREPIQALRSPAGEEIVLENFALMDGLLQNTIVRKLSDTETVEYARPYLNAGEDRRALLAWTRQIPDWGRTCRRSHDHVRVQRMDDAERYP